MDRPNEPGKLQATQETYEQRFACPVCLGAHLEMVSGMCQHRVCANCLYDVDSNHLRRAFVRCPICQQPSSFPENRPEIPDDNKEMMQCLGVRTCPNRDRGCSDEMWIWEIEDHLRTCSWKSDFTQKRDYEESPNSKKEEPEELPRTRKRKRLVTRKRRGPYNFRLSKTYL